MNEPLNYNILFEIDGFKNYFVGTDGIYSEKRGKMKRLKAGINNRGYYRVNLCKDGKKYYKLVHRLIAEMFIKNPDNLPDVDHINHDKTDNRLENLRWVSHQDNGRNRVMSKNNTSGEQGVCFYKIGNCSYWIADWYNNERKHKFKYFPVKKYGDEKAKQLAIDFRKNMVDELYNRV